MLNTQIDNIVTSINEHIQKKNTSLLISIFGGSSTGKSTIVCDQIQKKLGPEKVNIIELDNFQKGKESKNIVQGKYGQDTPQYFEVEQCIKILKAVKENQCVSVPIYDYKKGKQTGMNIISPKPVTIAEGLFAAYGQMSVLADKIIYVESPMYARMLRRILRNRYERYNAPVWLSFSNFFSTLNTHNELIASQKCIAHFNIFVPYNFQDSIHRFNLTPLYENIKQVDLIYRFDICQTTVLGVYQNNEKLFFTLLVNNKMYLDFEISQKQYSQLIELDFNSL